MTNFVLNFPAYLIDGKDPLVFTINPVQEGAWGALSKMSRGAASRSGTITTSTVAPAGKTRRRYSRRNKRNAEQAVTNE